MFFFTATFFLLKVNKLDSQGKKRWCLEKNLRRIKRPRYEGTFNHGKEAGLFKFF
jgi:hypothetical protein